MIAPELLATLRPLASRFESAGHRLYLVGGIVRDQQLGRPLDPDGDIDLTTDARPAEIKRLVAGLADAVWTQGERFGTIGCLVDGRAYEITTHRGESYVEHSRKPDVSFSDAIEHDLERRDFTINAMAVSIPDGELVDPFGGMDDLAAGVLRTPLAPETSFSDDPLRMLRAARFLAGHGLRADAALLAAVDALAPRMAIVSVERRRDELDKLLLLPDPRRGLRFVHEHGLAPFVLPDLADAPPSVVDRAIEAAGELPPVLVWRLAVLVGAADAPERAHVVRRLSELRYSNDTTAAVAAVVDGASTVWREPHGWTAPRVRRLVAATRAQLEGAIAVASTRIDTRELRDAIESLSAREPLDDLEPALDGVEVMALLGIGPGTEVGEALAYLRELRLAEGPLEPSVAAERLKEWWSRRGDRR